MEIAVTLLVLALLIVAGLAQVYKVQRDALAEGVLNAYKWIDEIIEALRNPDEKAGNESVDRLVDQRVDGIEYRDDRPGHGG